MALIDKVKAQATQLAQKAQEAGKAGQAKMEDVQAKRKADGLLRQLGAAVYAQRSGTAGAETAGEIDRLVGELAALEAQSGPVSAATDDSVDDTDTSTTPDGGFKLD